MNRNDEYRIDEMIEREIDDWIEGKHEWPSMLRCGNCHAEAVTWAWLDNGDIAGTCSRCGTVGVRRK